MPFSLFRRAAAASAAVAETPLLNSLRKGRRLILLEDVTVAVLIERELQGERVPEPVGIQRAQAKSFRQIHEEIREHQRHPPDRLGSLSGLAWVTLLPSFLLRAFMRLGSRSVRGSIVRREGREHLCLTVSFDIVDGAPAARFMRRLAELIRGGPAAGRRRAGTLSAAAATWRPGAGRPWPARLYPWCP